MDNVGPSALFTNVGRVDRVKSEYWDKTYNQPDLEAVLDASMISTAVYATRMKASIYGVPRPDEDSNYCYSFAFLPEPSTDLMKIWNKASQSLGGGGGTVQGLFRSPSSGPQIFILRGASRWTLVHELMHYNFDKTRAELGQPSIDDLLNDVDASQRVFDKSMADFKDFPNRRDLDLASRAVSRMIRAIYQLNVQVFLEEVTIESLLIEEFYKGRLKVVRKDSAESGVWYIGHSKKNAVSEFKDYLVLAERVEKLATENIWTDIADEMKANRALVESIVTRIDELATRARQRLGLPPEEETPSETTGLVAASVVPEHMHDAHTAHFTESPRHKANKRGVLRLVEKYK